MRMMYAIKILGLAMLVGMTGLQMGACPVQDVLNVGTPSGQQNPSGNGPAFQFVLPNARMDVQAGTDIGVQWTDSHPAGAATVQLFYDIDGVPSTNDEKTVTIIPEAAGTTGGSYAWNTTGVAPNKYRFGAIIDDHVNPVVTVYLAYEVVIRAKTATQGQTAVLTMLQPGTKLTPLPGESIKIRWTVENAPAEARLYLYYDVDAVPDNANELPIAVVNTGSALAGNNDYGWTIPTDMANGKYYILGRLSIVDTADQFAYAPGVVEVNANSSTDAVRDLDQVGRQFQGVTFDGQFPNARMGEVLAGGKDFNGDGYPDFMLVAPKSYSPNAFYTEQEVGEAYLVYSSGATGRLAQGVSYPISLLGSYNGLLGVTFVGPSFDLSNGNGSTSGIQEVLFVDDQDSDSRPEILFGIPDVNRIFEDQQDYDPLDNDDLHGTIPPARVGAIPGEYYYQADGWQKFSDDQDVARPAGDDLRPEGWPEPVTPNNPNPTNPGKRSGMIIYISSQSEGAIRNLNVLLDEVGGRVKWARPNIVRANGMRLYPLPSSDLTLWGSQMAQADLLGNLWGTLLVARPMDANGVGSVRIMLQQVMAPAFAAWTAAPTLPNFAVQPPAWTFPAADSTPGADQDRTPEWPAMNWFLFMDAGPTAPDPRHYNLMNSDTVVGANGHLGHPTNLIDFNGDTVGDIAVSAPDATPAGLSQAGVAYLVLGSPAFQGLDLSRLGQGLAMGMQLEGTEPGEQLGSKMAGPGDMNGDGFNDWILTAPNRSWGTRANCGAAVIVYGGGVQYGRRTLNDVIPLLKGAIIYGPHQDAHLGLYLAAIGDTDRDGYQDFLISAPDYSDPLRPNCGAVYLVYGGPHLVGEFDIAEIGTAALPGRLYLGPQAGAAIGPVAAAGDTDQDFYTDFLIGYPGATSQGYAQAGRAWLIYGSRRNAP